MAIQTKTYLYEALIRFGEDGYAGSHQVHMQKVWDDSTGEVLAESEMPARPISDTAVADLVGEQALLMGEQITALQAERDELASRLKTAEMQIAAFGAPEMSNQA